MRLALAIGAILLTSQMAQAEVKTLASAGVWSAFGGTSNNGSPVCGVSSSDRGRYFGVKFFSGDDSFTIQLGTPEWRVRDESEQKIVVRFDARSPWNGKGTGMHFGDGDAGYELNIRRTQLTMFMDEFRGSSNMRVQFPGGDKPEWFMNLNGTNDVSDTFARCSRNLR